MPPVNAAFSRVVSTDTSSASIVAGGATGAATSGTGGFAGGTLKLSAGIAIDGGTLTDHGIVIPSAVPADTTMALYNNAGTLSWNGTVLAAGSSVSGTTGTIAKFTASSAVGNSIITESGTTITVAGTVNATTAYQLGGISLNTAGTLTNVAYLDQSNVFTSASGQRFTGGIAVSGGTQSTAGIMIPAAVPAVLTTNLHNVGGVLTWPSTVHAGSSTAYTEIGSAISVVGTSATSSMSGAGFDFTYANNSASAGVTIGLYRQRGTIATPLIVQDDDTLGTVLFGGGDGTGFIRDAASITCFVDGTPGANDMPARLVFSTTPDGAAAVVARMTIDNAGNIGINAVPITAAKLYVISTSNQFRAGYDASNYVDVTVASDGATTFAATGAGAAFTFSQAVTGSAGFVGNLTGNASGTAATVTGAAQAAITSLGTLTTLNVAGQTLLTAAISPTQLVANTDNWSPTGLSTCNVIRIDVSGALNITGIVAQPSGTMILLHNTTAFTISLMHDVTSTAANRFYCPNAGDFPLTALGSVWIRYDGTSSRWTVVI